MPPTTRKKAQGSNNNLQPLNIVSAGADVTTTGVAGPKYKDDDPFERVFDPLIDVPSDDHDSDHSDYGSDKKKRKRKPDRDQKGKSKKRLTRRGVLPPPFVPDLSDDEYALNGNVTEEEEDGGLWSVEYRDGAKKSQAENNELSPVLTFEASCEGGAKAVVKLDLAALLKKLGAPPSILPATPGIGAAALTKDATMAVKKVGFIDLPFELRVKTYRLLFRDDRAIEFERRDFSHSAHFLRTCKTVHQEGREVLYGENSFHFTRDTSIRGRYYEHVWKEVGYKDIRRFLEAIGPDNMAQLKYISFVFTDGADNRTRHATQIPERKFVNDPHLHHIFRLIGENTTLRTLAVQFAGRAWVSNNDFHFLKAFTGMRCNNFVTIYRFRGLTNKCASDLKNKMKQVMRVKQEKGDRIDWSDIRNKVKMVYEGSSAYPAMQHYAHDW
ncbi:hypothetical protein AYL99_08839 [Fonsecaea erecta]|uniref:Uncharacterized protein n=1 Tax=Fonsecaea erecta TaxID=1367422 RepID=A0A178ZAC7_9EURO|nr:hypothetical protein AYL99_08839 [Fonsecaea erecta]OAP56727.1 hypothetical protein AYL99_08839 [Fonsecaea erecta]